MATEMLRKIVTWTLLGTAVVAGAYSAGVGTMGKNRSAPSRSLDGDSFDVRGGIFRSLPAPHWFTAGSNQPRPNYLLDDRGGYLLDGRGGRLIAE
jgi:hypothetical protein